MKFIKYILVLSLVIVMSVSLSAKEVNGDGVSKEQTVQSQSVRAQIVIVRPADLTGKAINVYIDGEYVSSLLPGAYTEESVCAGKHRISFAYTNVANRYKAKRKGGKWIAVKSKAKYVFVVAKKGNSLYAGNVSPDEVSKILKKYTKKQSHTISRLDKRQCRQPSVSQ